MSELSERVVEIGGRRHRVWEKGSGRPVVHLAGLGGLPRWTPFLDRLAEDRRVIAPSLPGQPGATGHEQLDDLLDWISATLDLLEAIDARGADLIGVSWGGAVAAEIAAVEGARQARLVLCAPFGLFDEREPVTDVWAQIPGTAPALLCAEPERLNALLAMPEGEDPVEWQILQTRASEAAARMLWPTTDTGLAKRLHRIRAKTLILWGSEDRVIPASYAKRLAEGISGEVRVQSIPGAGHLADLDAPEEVAAAIRAFLPR